jgi:hypothetical protein
MGSKSAKRALLGALICAGAIAGVGVDAAQAAGKPEQGVDHARSICAFSGLNDEPDAEFPEGGRTQSYGQLVRKGLKDVLPSPGDACNPTKEFEE